VFDVSACGGFVISDWRQDLGRLFGKEEIASYTNIDDLREKIKHFLAYPEEREEMARRARKRVLGEHTFLHRMREVTSILEEQGL
jgi:spore maturation protein CgeB